jgi:hypothetical protein
MTRQSEKPNRVPSMLVPAIFFCAIFLLGIGYVLWNAKAESDRKRLEAFGIENFNSTQLEQWKRCNSISASLEKVFDEVPLTDDNKIQSVRRLILPGWCRRGGGWN